LCNVTVTTTICDSGTNARLVCASNADCPGSTPSGVAIPVYTTSTNFQFSNTIEINGLSTTAWDGRNCTDPNYLALTGTRPACTVYPNPGDPFSQVGDFHYAGTGGHVHNYRPNRAATPVSAYKSGVKRLAVAWDNYQSGQYPSTQPDTDDGWDFFSLAQKDNDPAKATVVYLAGHTYATTVTGNRIVLNTLLNLGADPISSDRALAAPVAFTDANGSDSNGTRAIVVTSTYSAVSGYPPNSDTYVQSAGSLWVFPYTPGHLRAHSLIGGDQLTVGQSNHDQHTLWDADGKMPLPADRNLFTYFGGDLATNPTLPGGGVAPHGILQMGWVPENVAGTSINGTYGGVPNPSCVDVLTYGGFHNKKKNTNTFGFVAGGDGVCDLQQATEFTALNPGADFGVSEHAANEAALLSDLPAVQQMLQHVRGYCFATSGHADGSGTPILQPTDGQCNAQNFNGDNRAHIGGLAHSSPAVIPPSTNVVDSGALRPTVAYVAGLDGQLHAFYVSGGSGYTGPSGSVTYVNTQASSKFVTDWASKFAAANLPAPGTELWSFLPPSQLPLLKGNSARVDSTPVVQDVFIDPGGKGVREWHTVLVISTGNTGRELFAMDITNPLKPALMWDLMGSLAQTTGTPAYSTLALANDPTTGAAFSFKWDESAANFVLPPGTDPGRTASGLYDYSDLGGASGLTIAQLRAGLEPVYAVFATSNASGVNTQSKALEAFGIDVATGQKLWQWEQPYSAAWADNTVPVVGTVLGGTDGANRLLVGDMEGRVWDLSAMTGANLQTFTGITGCTGACKFALFDTQSTNVSPQPITTNISIAKIPNPATAGSLLVPYQGSNVLLFGTAGADWVASSVVGNMHLVLLDDQYKVPFRSGGTHLDATAFLQPAALSAAQTSGVLQEPSGFPIALAAGEHLYGNLTVAGQTVYFESAKGSVNDLMTLSATTAGATYSIDLGAATTGARYSPLTGFALANFGGVAVFHNQDTMTTSTDYVIGSEVSQMALLKISNSTATGASSPNVQLAPPGTATNASRFLGWVRRVLK
jgi:type IV pilus assembly protein PilY1